VAQAQERMSAKVNLVRANRCHRARGTDGHVSLHEHHARHVPGQKMRVIGLGSGGPALCRNKSVSLEFTGKLAEGLRFIARKDERSFDRFERGAARQASAGGCILRKRELLAARNSSL